MSRDDFDPDAHPPIVRTRCLATAWFDDDPMPALCVRAPGHDGEHVANVIGTNVRVVGPLVVWEGDERHREAAVARAGVEVAPSYTDGIPGRQIGSERTEGAA